MRLTISAILALAAFGFIGMQAGPSSHNPGEYDAVFPDGPYSYLPADSAAEISSYGAPQAESDPITAEEALRVDAMLDILARDPVAPLTTKAPLDAPVPSDTGLLLAGL